ncbi:MAG TPA: phosphoribosylamine--glycine ligase [Candidatus Onthomonas avicola]|nr:phosphoribosylamine--glycine ligase [Candidatus Onthomonas avicola]
MKVLVVGGGGREHAICWKLAQSPRVTELYCAPGNGGIAQVATCVPIAATDVEAMVRWAKEQAMDFVVVAPDDPLALGMVDALEAEGIRAFGPRKNAAIIEASKAFSKELMRKYHIPTAKYQTFTDEQAALAYIDREGAPIVVKADGLALGKGVTVAATAEEAKAAVRDMMEGGKFGASGRTVVIEECMTGPEVTVLAFADGKTVVPMLSSQDHKRAYDGNQGPNTGGMGAFCPSPNYTPEIAERCMREIFLPTMEAMRAEGRPFQGVLYFGLMLTPDGPKVVEYNARFGDPETQPLMMMLETDLMDIFEACVDGTLDRLTITWKPGAACCLVLASGGYPLSYQKGYPISGLDQVPEWATVFHAGTRLEDGVYTNQGGRVLGVTATGRDLADAVARAYEAARPIHWTDMHFRTDIGKVWVD